jgi:glutaminyl-peptide cyclotransferase
MKYFLILISSLFLLSGCNQNVRETAVKTDSTAMKAPVNIPAFNADSAYQYVKTQVEFGPRVPNTAPHEKCAAWLVEKFKGYTPDLIIQKGQIKAWNGTPLNFKNIIASWNTTSANRIFLCAHWDSRPYADHDPDPKNHRKPVDAANDGASGVGILLELARQMSIQKPAIGIDLVLFDVEDYGPPEDQRNGENTEQWWGQGADYWARNPHKIGYTARYGILLDMVGAQGATFPMEGVSMQYASDILKLVWNTANRAGYSGYFVFEPGGYITDDHGPINKIMNIPTIDIIHLDKKSETGFYPYWHTTRDNLASIDKTTLKAVGQTLLTVIFEEK